MDKVKKILIIAGSSIAVLAIVFLVGIIIGKKKSKTPEIVLPDGETVETEEHVIEEDITVDNATVEEIVSPASELVTYKYYYTDAGTYEKDMKFKDTDITIPFSTDKTVYTYSGVISSGIDTGDIEYDIDNEKKKIIVHLPSPKIISHELDEDSFKSYDVKKSIFTESDLTDYGKFIGELKQNEEDKLNENTEFWDSLQKNTENTVSTIMSADGRLDEYQITYVWSDSGK